MRFFFNVFLQTKVTVNCEKTKNRPDKIWAFLEMRFIMPAIHTCRVVHIYSAWWLYIATVVGIYTHRGSHICTPRCPYMYTAAINLYSIRYSFQVLTIFTHIESGFCQSDASGQSVHSFSMLPKAISVVGFRAQVHRLSLLCTISLCAMYTFRRTDRQRRYPCR